MKNSLTPAKMISMQFSPRESLRNYSKPAKISPNIQFINQNKSPPKEGTNKQIYLISNLRNQLGNIKNEVTKLIEKYPTKQCQPHENDKTVDEPTKNPKDLVAFTPPNSKTIKKTAQKNPEKGQELQRLTEQLEKIRKELKETLKRQTTIINEKGKLLETINGLQKEKKELQLKLNHLENQLNQSTENEKKLKRNLQTEEKEKKSLGDQVTKLKAIQQRQRKQFEESLEIMFQKSEQTSKKMNEIVSQKQNLQRKLQQVVSQSQNQSKKENEKLNNIIKGLHQELGKVKKQYGDKDHLRHEIRMRDKTIQGLNGDLKKIQKQLKSLLHFKHDYYASNENNYALNEQIITMKLAKLNEKYQNQ